MRGLTNQIMAANETDGHEEHSERGERGVFFIFVLLTAGRKLPLGITVVKSCA